MMFEVFKSKRALFGDLVIAAGILLLAFLLKDAAPEKQTMGFVTVLAAVLIRVQGAKCKSCRKANSE